MISEGQRIKSMFIYRGKNIQKDMVISGEYVMRGNFLRQQDLLDKIL